MFGWLDVTFSPPAVAATAVLTLYLSLVGPILGRQRFRSLGHARIQDETALETYYRRSIIRWWALAGLVLLISTDPGLRPSSVGIALPSGPYAGAGVGLAAYLVAAVGFGVLWARRRLADGEALPSRQAVAAMLPYTRRERRLALAMAATHGVTEELIFRGLLITAGVSVLNLQPAAAAAAALMIFAINHLYQGCKGVITISLLGAMFTLLYLLSASLLLPALVHTVIDIASLVLVPTKPRGPSAIRRN